MFREVKPSAELEAETLGLLLELRDHPPAPPAPKRNLKPLFITTASLVAALLITVIGVGFFHGVVKKEEDYFDFSEDSVIDDLFEDKSELKDDNAGQTPPEDPAEDRGKENEKDSSSQDDSSDDSNEDGNETMDSAPDEEKSNDEEPSVSDETDVLIENDEESLRFEWSGSEAVLAKVSEPEKLNTGGYRTYLSIKEFADALDKRATMGYGNRYYNARELLIVPSKLPNCRFRQLYLDSNTGAYTYQYTVLNGPLYYLTIENKSQRAANLQQLKEQISDLEGETVNVTREGNKAVYTFGSEVVTATLTVAGSGSIEIPQDHIDKIFDSLALTRCTLDNQLLEMTFATE